MIIRVISIILLTAVSCNAGELVTSFGPTIDTNVVKGSRYVFDVLLEKTTDWCRPYVGVQTLFGELNGQGSFNPTSAKFTVGVRFRLSDNLYITADHYSRHAIDAYERSEKFTAIKLEHRFRIE